MDQKQSDVLTLIHLIKTESQRTREELAKTFEAKMSEGFSKQKSELRKEMRQSFNTQRNELKGCIDDKFENFRRNVVDDIQNFQDEIITEIKELRQETAVNTSHSKILADHETRLTKIEKHIFSN